MRNMCLCYKLGGVLFNVMTGAVLTLRPKMVYDLKNSNSTNLSIFRKKTCTDSCENEWTAHVLRGFASH